MNALTLSSVVTASQDQISAELGGEAAILALEEGTYYGLSETGALIWRMLQAPVTVSAILGAIVAEYDVTAEDAERDLFALLHELLEKKLIVVNPE